MDDVLALLLALAGSPDDLEVVLISVTFGNVQVEKSAKSLSGAGQIKREYH